MKICSSCRFKYQDNAERCPICDGTAYTMEPNPIQQAPAMDVWHEQERARARAGNMGQGNMGQGMNQQGQGPMNMNRQGMPMGQGQGNMNQNVGQQYQGGVAPQQRPQPQQTQVYQPQPHPQQPQPPFQAPIPQPRQQPQPIMAPDISSMPPKDAKKAQAKYQKSLAAGAKKSKQSAASLQTAFTQDTDTDVSIKDWLIYHLLLMIPIYGIIHIFLTAFSKSMNIKPSLKTYAKYQLIIGAIGIVLMVLLSMLISTYLSIFF